MTLSSWTRRRNARPRRGAKCDGREVEHKSASERRQSGSWKGSDARDTCWAVAGQVPGRLACALRRCCLRAHAQSVARPVVVGRLVLIIMPGG